MRLFSLKDKKLSTVSIKPIKLEKEIQEMIEGNLKEVFNLDFVKSEFHVKNFRIDTLGFNRETKSFVIIEYKRDKNFSVIDQGYTYLSLMLNNKSDFILEFNENNKQSLKRDDLDWSQSKVIFVSTHFTEYQKNSVNFKDVPFELWEIKNYEGNLVGLTQHKTTSEESISSIQTSQESVVSKVTREIKVYSEEHHITPNLSEEITNLYFKLKERICNLDEVEMIPRKLYICFSKKTNFVDVEVRKKDIKLYLNLKKGELDDPKKLTKDVSNQGHWGNGDYEIRIQSDSDLDYIMFLINQSYKKQG